LGDSSCTRIANLSSAGLLHRQYHFPPLAPHAETVQEIITQKDDAEPTFVDDGVEVFQFHVTDRDRVDMHAEYLRDAVCRVGRLTSVPRSSMVAPSLLTASNL
jgi:hypothetical protein